MLLVVGLGNPGIRYSETRHNVGWFVVDDLADDEGARWRSYENCALVARTADALLVKPTTFMNESGLAVASLKTFYRVEPESILVVFDDLNLPLGMIRVRARGSSGGHKGIQSIIERLGTDEFPRLRLGIGPKPKDYDGRDFVLSPFEKTEEETVDQMVEEACGAVRTWMREGTATCMNAFNKRIAAETPPDAPGDEPGSKV